MHKKGIIAIEFIDRMDYAYAAANMIISRAGAIAISEICAVGKPCILVPLPTAAEDHQKKNAMALVEKEAAILVENNKAVEILGDAVFKLLSDEEKQNTLSNNLKKLAITDAAERIVDEIINLINT